MVARKAEWLLDRPGGVRTFKIKVGRAKWMESFEAALARDVAVVAAVRRAVGDGATLLVDGNNGYRQHPLAAAEFGLATAGEDVLAMEEMFDEELTAEAREVKRRLRSGFRRAIWPERLTRPSTARSCHRYWRSSGLTTCWCGLATAIRSRTR